MKNAPPWTRAGMPEWVRLPSGWILAKGLRRLHWADSGRGSDNVAALMALSVIAHGCNQQTGSGRLTYDVMQNATGLSRSKLSNGLAVLEKLAVIERAPQGRSTYRLADFNPEKGWAKFPARRLYSDGRIIAFDDFKLRQPTELNALKLYFLFAAQRNRDTNAAKISYDTIEGYSGIGRSKIRSAISLLAAGGLVHVEHFRSDTNDHGVANGYRLIGLDPYLHMGTALRGKMDADL